MAQKYKIEKFIIKTNLFYWNNTVSLKDEDFSNKEC